MIRQIYMWSGEREMLLARHDFYMEQVKVRVLGNFGNIEMEANKVAEEVYDRIKSECSDGYEDMAAATETALEHGEGFYMLLSDMKIQTTLGALASLYHQWEKDFRGFMERELSEAYGPGKKTSFVWQSSTNQLFDFLEKLGWYLRRAEWFPLLNTCSSIVNVYKHGKGRSLDELSRDYPQYLKRPFEVTVEEALPINPDHEDLLLEEEEFNQIAGALRQFWVDFPERLFLT